jgi:hypothetical protein
MILIQFAPRLLVRLSEVPDFDMYLLHLFVGASFFNNSEPVGHISSTVSRYSGILLSLDKFRPNLVSSLILIDSANLPFFLCPSATTRDLLQHF